jgi:hypothetical protein
LSKFLALSFGTDHCLPSAHLGLDPAALDVAGGFLPGHPTFGLNFGDVAVATVGSVPIAGFELPSWEAG